MQADSGLTTGAADTSYYSRLGGAEPLRVAVDRFYVAVLGDPQLAPYFDGVDMAHVKRHQALLLAQVLGGPSAYTGRDLGEAHRHLDIAPEDYDRVVRHLVDTLEGMRVPGDIVGAVEQTVAGVRDDIVRGGAALSVESGI